MRTQTINRLKQAIHSHRTSYDRIIINIASRSATRTIMTTTTTTTTTTQPSFSANADIAALKQELDPLLNLNGGKWALTTSGNGLERSFRFKTFKKTWVRIIYISTYLIFPCLLFFHLLSLTHTHIIHI